ncbi:MAG: hypothetical protein WB760_09955 [Xanthobacteraceae bacterium]
MIEKAWLAVMALAAAYLLVTLIPGLAPEVSARTADKTVVARPATEQHRNMTGQETTTACTESWPYCQPACLHDSRQPGGRARTVRIISAERFAIQGSGSSAL